MTRRTPTPFRLELVAPRLARARDEHNAIVRARDRRQAVYDDRKLELDRLIAHRELQLQRAQAAPRKARKDGGDRIARRRRYLVEARQSLAALEARRERWLAGELDSVHGDTPLSVVWAA